MMNDLISRQAAITEFSRCELTPDGGIDANYAIDFLKQMPPAQPSVSKTEIVGDIISRQAAINEILDDLKDTSLHDDPATPEDFAEGYDEGIRNAAATVFQMPPAQPVVISKSENTTECEDAVSRSHFDKRVRLAGGMSEEELTDDFKDGVLTVLEMLRTEPPVTPKQPGWIPCSERCPEQSGWYLVSLKNGNVQKAWYRVAPINQGGSYWRSPIKRPLAWMPLPTPYREGEKP